MASGFDHRRSYGFSRNQDQFPSHDDFTMANDRRRRTEAERQRQDARPSRGHSRGYGEVHNYMRSTVDSDPTITGARRKTFPPQQRGYTGREQSVSSGRYVPHQRRMEDRSYGTHRETRSYARRFHAPTCTGTDHMSRPPAFETRSGFERGSRGNDELTSGYGKQKNYRTDFKRRPLDNRTAPSHWRGERGRHNRVPRTRTERTPDEESDFRRYSTSFFTMTTERSENEATRNPSSDSSNTRPSNDSIAEPHQTPEKTSDQMVSSEPYRVKPTSTTPALTEKQLQSFLEDKPSDILNELIRKKDACMALLCQDQIDDNTIELTLQVLSALCNLDPLSAYTEELNTVLAMVESSLFLSKHVTRFLVGFIVKEQEEVDDNDHDIWRLTMVLKLLKMFLQHKPSRFSEVGGALILLEKIVTSSSLMEDLKQLKIAYEAVEQAQRSAKQWAMEKPPPNNFRDIQIFPESREIRLVARPFLRKNIIQGRYENVEHYLDVQFRLLREDFVAPLREGVTEFLSNTTKRPQDIRIYNDIFIRNETIGENGFVYTLEFNVTHLRRVRWEESKRLLYGSFVCLTKDNFQNIICATVENRDAKDLAKGKLGVRFLAKTKNLSEGPYIMAESAAYFEACRHVLHGLQQIDEYSLPFKKYIVDVTSIVDPPEYLRGDQSVVYDFTLSSKSSSLSSYSGLQIKDAGLYLHRLGLQSLLKSDRQTELKTSNVPILKTEAWPSADELHLDESQRAALQTALTKEFAIIQGPPGTGKTYVGLKIVQLLLHNRCRVKSQCIASSPILVVCYTNHALDQFLEGIHGFGEREIIRVGGRSKSELLEDMNLSKKRDKRKRNVVFTRLRGTDERIRRLLLKLELPRKVLLNVKALQNYMSRSEYNALLIQQRGRNEPQEEPQKLLDWLGVTEDNKEDKMIEQWVFQENAAYDPGCNKRCGKNHDLDPVTELKKSDMMTADEASRVERVWSLKFSDRWRLYRLWVRKYLEENEAELQRHRQAHDDLSIALKAVNMQHDPKEVEKTKSRLRQADKIICSILLKIELPTKVLLNVKALRKYMSHSEYGALLMQHQEGMKPQENPQKLLNWLGVSDVSESIYIVDEGRRIQMDREIDERGDFRTIRVERLQAIEQEILRENAAYDLQCNKRCGKNRDVIPVVELQKPDVMSDKEASGVNRVWSLKILDRWRLYRLWVKKYLEDYEAELQEQRQVYDDLSETLQDMRTEEDFEILREANVVGMTTTGAAKYRAVLQRLRPGIVVVEEAAEVLEAHIITTLTAACQHLILIGDHQQLKPNPTVYRLARQFNLDTSLFERMINNGVPCNTLSHQHRMRPEISSLMKKHFYQNLHDDISVLKIDDIKGVKHNMFFIDHQHFEDETDDNKTKSNEHEAHFLVGLCKYFIHQGYEPSQITVLTAYTGQLFCFRRLMDRKTFQGVRVCVVDNFQGEENDIILLSLVRSNEEGSIGFLRTSNRVCVALSRARMGFYCIGNASILKKAEIWRKISTTLLAEKRIGTSLPLVCQNHQDKITEVESGEDFKKVPLGGCGVPCEYRLPCGHVCDLLCHPLDPNHEKYECQKPCPKYCDRQHPCPFQCFEGCNPCDVKLTKTMSDCGHVIQVYCHKFDAITCPMPCPRLYDDCEHRCRKLCGENCLQTCPEECERKLLCGHSCRNPCGDPCTDYCEVQVQRTLVKCGHAVRMDCGGKPDEHLCKVMVWRTLPRCDHRTEMFCHEDPDTAKCMKRCEKVLECGHQCKNKCFQNCQEMCLEDCERALSCGHPCKGLCCDPCSSYCTVKVERTLTKCGHTVRMDCGKSADEHMCTEKVYRDLSKCDHRAEMPCHQNPDSFECKERCEKLLECGHRCPNVCGKPCKVSDLQQSRRGMFLSLYRLKSDTKPCEEPVEKSYTSCGHTATVPCHKDLSLVPCTSRCELLLSCGHRCPNVCGKPCEVSDLQQLRKSEISNLYRRGENTKPCEEPVEKTYTTCGHTATVPCQRDISSVPCLRRCELTLPCGHQCPRKCGQSCLGEKVDDEIIYKDNSAYTKYNSTYFLSLCQERCKRELPCGHKCPNKCGEPCPQVKLTADRRMNDWLGIKGITTQCQELVKKKLPNCDHIISVRCPTDVRSFSCTENCERVLPCGHRCPNKCIDPCPGSAIFKSNRFKRSKNYRQRAGPRERCEVTVTKARACGHSIKTMPCWKAEQAAKMPCKEPCRAELRCGHACTGNCHDCQQGSHHKPCTKNCTKQLLCGHMCGFECSKICSQDCRKCSDDHRQTKSRDSAASPSPSCKHNITHHHLKTKTCIRPCDRKLQCKHPCIGVCNEPCPPYCSVCSKKSVRSNLPKGSPIRPRDLYIYLPNCKHLCEMRILDRMFTTVKNTLEKDYFLIRPVPCPKCKEPIRHCSRYNGILQTVTESVNTARQICARSRRGDVGTTPLSFASGKWMRCRLGHVFFLEEENEVVGRQKEPRCSECSQKNG